MEIGDRSKIDLMEALGSGIDDGYGLQSLLIVMKLNGRDLLM